MLVKAKGARGPGIYSKCSQSATQNAVLDYRRNLSGFECARQDREVSVVV